MPAVAPPTLHRRATGGDGRAVQAQPGTLLASDAVQDEPANGDGRARFSLDFARSRAADAGGGSRFSFDSDRAGSLSDLGWGLSDLRDDGRVPRTSLRAQVDTDAMIRREYFKRIGTQIWLSNLSSSVYYLGVSAHDWARDGPPWGSQLRLQKLLCGILSAALLILSTLRKISGSLPPRLRLNQESLMRLLMQLEVVTYGVINMAAFYEFFLLADVNCPGVSRATCGQRYLFTFHTAILPKWITSQFTGRFIFFPEVVRNVAFTVLALVMAASDGSLTFALVPLVVLEAVASFFYGLLIVKLCRALIFEDRHLPAMGMCPARMRGPREAIICRIEALVVWLLDEPVIDFNAVPGAATGAVLVCAMYGDVCLYKVSAAINLIFLATMLTSFFSKKLGGTIHGLRLMARRLGLGAEQRALYQLRAHLSAQPSETAILRAASAALSELLPGATATAVATFRASAEGGDDDRRARRSASPDSSALDGLEVFVAGPAAKVAMEAALKQAPFRGSSVQFVCRQAPALGIPAAVAWTGDFAPGITAFSDWRAAHRAGLTGEAVTVAVAAGPAVLGFIMAHFAASSATKAGGDTGVPSEQLRELCEMVGAALFARRSHSQLQASQSIVNDVYPMHVAKALEARARREEPGEAAADGLGDDDVGCAAASPAEATQASFGTERASSPPPRPARMSSITELPRVPPDEACTRGVRAARASTTGGRISRGSSQLFAEACDSVTVVFADLVGFTSLAQERTPEEVMSMLHDLFSRFDTLCAQHSCFKVETIGDCYMAVSGLLPRRQDHAPAALRFAIDMLAQAAAVELDGHPVELRIGMHSGPVTAGLIGRTRARYCLFGDTVNTASRMESTGVPGAVHLSADTAALCGVPETLLEQRVVEVKGKGPMQTRLLAKGPAMDAVLSWLGPPTLPATDT